MRTTPRTKLKGIVGLATMLLGLVFILTPNVGATTATEDAHLNANQTDTPWKGVSEGDCPDDAEGFYGWHFVTEGQAEFTSITAEFETDGTVVKTVDPSSKHVYLFTSTADVLEDASATVINGDGDNKFQYSHWCEGSQPEECEDDEVSTDDGCRDKTCEQDQYDCPVECEDDEVPTDDGCRDKTCEQDQYDCPVECEDDEVPTDDGCRDKTCEQDQYDCPVECEDDEVPTDDGCRPKTCEETDEGCPTTGCTENCGFTPPCTDNCDPVEPECLGTGCNPPVDSECVGSACDPAPLVEVENDEVVPAPQPEPETVDVRGDEVVATLPVTGAGTQTLAGIGILLMGAGATLVGATRRRATIG